MSNPNGDPEESRQWQSKEGQVEQQGDNSMNVWAITEKIDKRN